MAALLEPTGAVLVEGSVPVLGEIVIKSLVVLLLATSITAALPRASAALRHFLWTMAIGGVLVLPLLVTSAPRANLLPHRGSSRATTASQPQEDPTPAAAVMTSVDVVASHAVEEPGGPPGAGAKGRPVGIGPAFDGVREIGHARPAGSAGESASTTRFLAIVGLAIWMTGVVVNMLALAASLLRVVRLARHSRDITDSAGRGWLEELCVRSGVSRPVNLLTNDRCSMPATWRLRRTCVLVPTDFAQWPADRQEAVLLHELAHIARHDPEIQIFTRLACALYWFNPLIWFAARQMARERERACDDAVLRLGHRPSDYAEHLLRVVVQSTRRVSLIADLSTGMVQEVEVGDRVRAILDATRCRDPLTTRTRICGTIAASLILVPLGMLSSTPSVAETPAQNAEGRPEATSSANHEDVLPPGAVLRLGSDRFRQEGEVRQLQYSPDGSKIASINNDAIMIWDARGGNVLRSLRRSQQTEFVDRFTAVCFAPDGIEIAAASGGAVHVWEVDTGLELLSSPLPSGELFRGLGDVEIRYSPNGERLAVTVGPNVQLLDTTTGELVKLLTNDGDRSIVTGICWMADNIHLSGATLAPGVLVWNTESGEVVRRFEIRNGRAFPTSLATSADETLLVAAAGGTVNFWRFDTVRPFKEIELDADFVHTLHVSPDNRTLVVGSQDGVIRIVDVESGQLKHKIESGQRIGRALAVSPNFQTVAFGGVSPTIRQWDIETGQEKYPKLTSFGHDAEVRCAAWSPDGRLIASGGLN